MKKRNVRAPGRLVPLLLLVMVATAACDSKKDALQQDVFSHALCTTLAVCDDNAGTRFGMVGDSWTDFALGFPAIMTLRDHLTDTHGFRLTTATLAGQKLDRALPQGLHYRVIDRAGPDIRYMLLSLGGNDLIFNSTDFAADPAAERARVIASIKSNLLTFVRGGNLYKKEKYGGADLVWVIHGYDYSNPDNPYQANGISSLTGCRSTLNAAGFSDSQIDTELPLNTAAYNQMLADAANEEASLYFIDLRSTLGGPPTSLASNMFDCIHPTTLGFMALTDKFVRVLDTITGGAR